MANSYLNYLYISFEFSFCPPFVLEIKLIVHPSWILSEVFLGRLLGGGLLTSMLVQRRRGRSTFKRVWFRIDGIERGVQCPNCYDSIIRELFTNSYLNSFIDYLSGWCSAIAHTAAPPLIIFWDTIAQIQRVLPIMSNKDRSLNTQRIEQRSIIGGDILHCIRFLLNG